MNGNASGDSNKDSDNSSIERQASLDSNSSEELEYGPDTEFVSTWKKIISAENPVVKLQKKVQTKFTNAHNSNNKTALVPFNSRIVPKVEDSFVLNLVSASLLDLFLSTLPNEKREHIRTVLIQMLTTGGFLSRKVFSDRYTPTRNSLVSNMSTYVLKMAQHFFDPTNPKVDDGLSLTGPTQFEQIHSRYEQDFEEVKEIGVGGFGKVFHSRSKVDHQNYAIKKIPLKESTEKASKKMLDECRFHASLQHPNVVRYHNAWVEVTVVKKPAMIDQHFETISTTTSFPLKSLTNEPEDSEETSNSSEESKKGFWATPQKNEKDDSPFVTFESSGSENDEVLDEEDDEDFSDGSDSSFNSQSARKLAKQLARDELEELNPRKIQMALDFAPPQIILQKTLYIQMELCHYTLEKYMIKRIKDQCIDNKFNEAVIDGLLSAVDFLHRNNVVHRDIKPSNIMMKVKDGKTTVLLGDFGLAREIEQMAAFSESPPPADCCSNMKLTSGLGTYLYAAPEQLNTKDYTVSADIFSSGIVIYELYQLFSTGSERIHCLLELRKTGQLSDNFRQNWPHLCSIVEQMIRKSAETRPKAEVLLKNFRNWLSRNGQIAKLKEEVERLKESEEFWKKKYHNLKARLQLAGLFEELSDSEDEVS